MFTSLLSISWRIGFVEMVSTFNEPSESVTLYNVTAAASLVSNAASSSAVDSSGTAEAEPLPNTWKKCSLSSRVLNSSAIYQNRFLNSSICNTFHYIFMNVLAMKCV